MATTIQYFNGMLDTNNEVDLNDFYPYIINYEAANPVYNKVSFESEYNTMIGDNFTTNTTEKSQDMLYALRKRLGFDRVTFNLREEDPDYDPDVPADPVNECVGTDPVCPGYKLRDITHIFDRDTYNCETNQWEAPEIDDRIDALAEVIDHERWDGSLYVMVRGSGGYNRYIFKQIGHNANNSCNELIDPDPCKGTFVLISSGDCDEEKSYGYSDDPCIFSKFVRFMGPKGDLKVQYDSKILYRDEDGVQGNYIICNGNASAGDIVYISGTGPLSGQRATYTGTEIVNGGATYCEISELLGGGTLSETGFYPGEYGMSVYGELGEILGFATGDGVEYITKAGDCPDSLQTIKDPTFYERSCPTLSSDKKWKVTGMTITPWGGIAIKHVDSPYMIYGANGSTGFSYFSNLQYVGREYTSMHNIFDHIVMLGYNKIGAVSPIYDGNGTVTGTKHIPIDDEVGYFGRCSFDFGQNSLTLFTNYKYFIRYKFGIGYSNQLTIEPDRFFKYDSLVTRISKKNGDEVSVVNNGGSTIVSIMNSNNTLMMLRDQKHQFDYLRSICGARIKGIKSGVRYGNGLFCRNCEKKDFGEYYKTYIRAKHGHRSLFSLKIINKLKLMFGSHSRFVKGKNIFSLFLDCGGEQRDRHTDDFYRTERGARLMKIKDKHTEEDESDTKLYSVQGTGKCIAQGEGGVENCKGRESTHDFMQRFCCFDPEPDCCSKFKAQSKIARFGVIELPISKWYSMMTRTLTTKDEAEFEFLGSQRSFNYPSTELTKISNVMGVKSVNQRGKGGLVGKKENQDRVDI